MSAYRDSDGDVWGLQEGGWYRCLSPGVVLQLPLDEVEECYGPLTELHEEKAAPMESPAPPMERTEALKTATDHVNSLSTNARGYQDGVRFADKVAAVERLARFLMGEAPDGGEG